MTDAELKELKALTVESHEAAHTCAFKPVPCDGCKADFRLARASFTTIPRLIAEVERLREERNVLVEALQWYAHGWDEDMQPEAIGADAFPFGEHARQALDRIGAIDDTKSKGNG